MSNVSHGEWEDAAAPSARGCGGRSRHADGIVFHKDKAGTNPVRFSLRVRVGADIMKATRWLTGDRMWLQISKARDKLRISRTTDGVRGWKLLGTNTAKPASGASCTAYFKATVSEDVLAALFPDELDYIPDADSIEIDGSAIICTLRRTTE